ncbi:MAG: DUF3368 domain-containing protein [Chloroflexi bacterium]|nr:MAG: DUF3368 domain-containing protein [Chloroflexota bacterium]
MVTVISDAGPLISLAEIGCFELLRALFAKVYIPKAVYTEVVIVGEGRPGAQEVREAIQEGWLEVVQAKESSTLALLRVDLDDGEAEALALATAFKASLLLMDERKGRIRAKAMGLSCIGTVGILLLARETGVTLDLQALLDDLRSKGFRISDALYEHILREAQKL